MALLPVGEWRPDVSDFNGQHSRTVLNVVPQGDGYGPFKTLGALTLALPAACRGYGVFRNTDGTVTVMAATVNRIYKLNNTTLGWSNVSKVVALTSITNASPAVVNLNSHGLSIGDRLQFTTTGTLPTGLSTLTDYYVIAAGFGANSFEVSATSGGTAINTSSAGSGTHSMTYKYSDVSSTDQWQFEQFGNRAIAVQANESPQTFTLGTDPAFSTLTGSPPSARYVTAIGRILVLSGLTSFPRRVQWCDLGDPTNWATGVANSIDMEKGGVVRGVAGGEFGLVLQESVIRRLVYNPGATLAFNIEVVAEDIGLLGPYSIAKSRGTVYFYSSQGFMKYSQAEGLVPIGKERWDRTVSAELDIANLQLLIATADPVGTKVFWAYKTLANSSSTFNKVICFDTILNRATPLEITGEYMAAFVVPGLTLDSLDSISSSVDALGFSLDSVSSSVGSKLSAISSTHILGVFDGANLEATLETAEQALDAGQRVYVSSLRPITDATDVRCSMKHRATQSATVSTTTESAMTTDGVCWQSQDTRYARAKSRIPASTVWTFFMGIEPKFKATGLI
jgi:hypothetical protein